MQMCIHDSASFSSRVSISGRVRGPFEHGSLGSKQSCPLLVRGQLKVSQTEDSGEPEELDRRLRSEWVQLTQVLWGFSFGRIL